jgi:hypothetical protein
MVGDDLTLVDRIRQVRGTYMQIQRERRKGHKETAKIDELRRALIEGEGAVNLELGSRNGREIEDGIKFKGRRVPARVLGYCFSNFVPVMNDGKYPTVFDRVPRILNFMDGVKSLDGRRVLSVRGADCVLGRISGPCRIENDRGFYRMLIPIEGESFRGLKVERYGKAVDASWFRPDFLPKDEEHDIFVDEDLFGRGRYNLSSGPGWPIGEISVDYSKDGGSERKQNIALYLGEMAVYDRFRQPFVVPEVRVETAMPN